MLQFSSIESISSPAYLDVGLTMRPENALGALRWIPDPRRPQWLAVQAFVREAFSFVHAPAYEGMRHFALEKWEHELFRTFHGEAEHPVFVALQDTVEHSDLPITPFAELLTGLRMELQTTAFATFTELHTYCQLRSATLGHIVLLLLGYRDPARLRYAQELCTALHLVSLLQNLGSDLRHRRVYIPVEDLHHFGLSIEKLGAGPRHCLAGELLPQAEAGPALRHLLRFQIARVRALFERGRPLLDLVDEDLARKLTLSYHSGQSLLDKFEVQGEALLTLVAENENAG